MRSLVLRNIHDFDLLADTPCPSPKAGEKRLKVLFCGICRTDARMWATGHRDLILPRVLGHEIAAWDEQEQSYCTLWPAVSCSRCSYCQEGRENLCQSLQIIGFHRDGGFAEQIVVPQTSIIHAPILHFPELLCFAEPIGCIANALDGSLLHSHSRVGIYGGGVLGILTAICCRQYGASVKLVENNREKIGKIKSLLNSFDVSVDTGNAGEAYDLSINCCDTGDAFSKCLEHLRKGGRFRYFSGVRSDEGIPEIVINLIHYRELEVRGCYGPRLRDMVRAVEIIQGLQPTLVKLIEDVVSLDHVSNHLIHVNSGMALKYIIDLHR